MAMNAHDQSTAPGAAPPRRRHLSADSWLALARPVELERLWPELAQQIHRALPCDGIAVALAAPSGEVRVATSTGYDEGSDELAHRLGAIWRASLADGGSRLDASPRGPELTVPIPGEGAPIGTITVRFDREDGPPNTDHAAPTLASIAAEAGAAIERSRQASRLAARAALDAATRVAAGIGAELRNPLFAISSAAQLLRYRAREDPVIERNAGRILREVEQLNTMVAALLEYGTPYPLHLAPIDPDAIWDEVVDGNRGLLESRSLALVRERPPHAARIQGDGARLAQLFLALLRNAADAAPVGTSVSLRSARLPDGAWRCSLHNEGEPIPSDVLPHVFEIFYSTRPGASGLGLAIGQRIAHEHHGSITLDSAPGRGTTATVTLPQHP